MPATLITLIGPVVPSELSTEFSATLTDLAAQESVKLTPSVPPNSLALSDLTMRQWSVETEQGLVQEKLEQLSSRARGSGVDVLITPARLLESGPRLVVTDVDSTLIQDEVIELLADHAGSRGEVERITEAAMRGELDFTESLLQRVSTLRGLDSTVFQLVQDTLRLSSGVKNLCRTLGENGDYIGVVSGGFIEIVQPLATALGIDFARANRLTLANDRLTGEISGEIVDRELKAVTLREWADQVGVPLERTIAIGDGANDLSMLAAAGLGVAFNAKPVVHERADAIITGPRIDAVLAVLGR